MPLSSTRKAPGAPDRLCSDVDARGPLGAELEGVVEEVLEDPSQQHGIGPDQREIVDEDLGVGLVEAGP